MDYYHTHIRTHTHMHTHKYANDQKSSGLEVLMDYLLYKLKAIVYACIYIHISICIS
jgi:hypothetical protein